MAFRVLAAGLIVAIGVGVGMWLHGFKQTKQPPRGSPGPVGVYFSAYQVHPSWADPLAGAVLVVAGFGAGAAVTAPRFVKPS